MKQAKATIRRLGMCGALVAALAMPAAPALGQRVLENIPQTDGVGLTPKVGDVLPLETPFKNALNNDVTLGSMFDDERPVLLLFVYFDCPLQCPFTMQQAQGALNELHDRFEWVAGEQYRLLVLSFDHNDTPRSANVQREAFLVGLTFEPLEGGVEFWVGEPQHVRKAADAAGFFYRYMPEIDEFSHVSSLIYVQPDGTIHNYMKGFPFPAPQVRLGLLEASEGKQGTIFEQVLQFCYSWSDSEGKYTLQAMRVMQLAGGVTVLALGAFVGGLFISGRVRGGRAGGAQRASKSGASKGGAMTNPTSEGAAT